MNSLFIKFIGTDRFHCVRETVHGSIIDINKISLILINYKFLKNGYPE